MIPESLKKEYPFEGKFHVLPCGQRIHYLDEGQRDAPAALLVHGNPTWSFFYRRPIMELRRSYRVIAPDLLGLGLSSRPYKTFYRLNRHIDIIEHLLRTLGVEKFHLVVHDWGGPIGLGASLRFPQSDRKSIILNTAAFVDFPAPWQIALCKTFVLGKALIYLNGFSWGAAKMAVCQPLSPLAKKGFLWPYRRMRERVGINCFVQDIPLNHNHPSYTTLKSIEEQIPSLPGKKLIIWGMKDFCFTPAFLERWQKIYPKAPVKTMNNAGHYLLEDQPQQVTREIVEFLRD